MKSPSPSSHASSRHSRHPAPWLAVGLCLVTFILRTYELDARSLWLDESATLSRIRHTWADIFQNVYYVRGLPQVEAHPPLFFASLKVWSLFAGDTDFALKLLTVAAGLIQVPLCYVLGRRLFGQRGGLLAALLAATNPAWQWYAQELRHYAPSLSLGILATYLLCRALVKRRRRWWVLWAVATVAGIATNLLNAGLFAGQVIVVGAIVAFWLVRTNTWRRIPILLGGVAMVAGGVTAVIVAWPRLQGLMSNAVTSLNTRGLEPLADFTRLLVSGSVFGLNANDPTGATLTWAFTLLALAGVVTSLARPDAGMPPGLRAARSVAMVGPVIMLVAMSTLQSSLIALRYALLIIPALFLAWIGLLVAALAWRPRTRLAGRPSISQAGLRVAAGVCMIATVLVQIYGTLNGFIPTHTWHDDWRSLANHIRAHWREGDLILNDSAYTADEVLNKYLGNLPARVTQVAALTPDSLNQLGVNYQRIWYVNTHGPDLAGEVGGRLKFFHLRDRIAFPSRTSVLELALLETASPVIASLPQEAIPLPAPDPSTQLRIAGYEIGPGGQYAESPSLVLTLYWQRGDSAIEANYRLSARLNAENLDWVTFNSPAYLGQAGQDWAPGRLYRVDYDVPILPGLPRLPYTLHLDVFGGGKDERVQTVTALVDPRSVDNAIRITLWPAQASRAPVWGMDNLALRTVEFGADPRPGETLPIALSWSVQSAGSPGWRVQVDLDALFGGNVASTAGVLGWGVYAVSQWPVDEPVQDFRSLHIPNTIASGLYRLSMTMSRDNEASHTLFLGFVQVRDYDFSQLEDSPEHPVDGQAGEIRLLGYTLAQPFERNAVLQFYTYWRVEARPAHDGVLFLHLLDVEGRPIAQDDNPPEQGLRSTQTYRPGEGIRQLHQLVVPEDAPNGVYRLYAGIYNREDFERWPAQQDGTPAKDNLIFLGELRLD